MSQLLHDLPDFLKKILQELKTCWLNVWNNAIVPALQALLQYLSEHNPKLEIIVQNLIVISEYVYIFSVSILIAEFELVEGVIKVLVAIIKKIIHDL